MRFVTFMHAGSERAGILLGDGADPTDIVVDLAHATMRPALGDLEPQMLAMIMAGMPKVVERLAADCYPETVACRFQLRESGH